jgi:hypothetical protein
MQRRQYERLGVTFLASEIFCVVDVEFPSFRSILIGRSSRTFQGYLRDSDTSMFGTSIDPSICSSTFFKRFSRFPIVLSTTTVVSALTLPPFVSADGARAAVPVAAFNTVFPTKVDIPMESARSRHAGPIRMISPLRKPPFPFASALGFPILAASAEIPNAPEPNARRSFAPIQ